MNNATTKIKNRSISLKIGEATYSVLSVMFVASVLLSGNVMWQYIDSLKFPRAGAFKMIALALAVLFILMDRKYSVNELRFVAIVFAYLGVFLLTTLDTGMDYLERYMLPMICMILLFINQIKHRHLHSIVNAYINVVFVIACVSLVFWTFGTVFNVLPGAKNTYYVWASRVLKSKSYFNIYYQNYAQAVTGFGRTIFRNTGIWTEAPGYASVLVYALILSILTNNKHKVYSIIFVLTLCSTLSGKSMVCLLEIAIIYYVFLLKPQKRSNRNIKIVLGLFVAVVIAGLAVAVFQQISSQKSFAYRVDSALAGIRTWSHHIVFGTGYKNTADILQYATIERVSKGISMGLTTLLGEGGLYLTLFVVFPYICLYRIMKRTRSFSAFVLVAVISFTDLIISNVFDSFYFMMIIGTGYSIIGSKRNRFVLTGRVPESTKVLDTTIR